MRPATYLTALLLLLIAAGGIAYWQISSPTEDTTPATATAPDPKIRATHPTIRESIYRKLTDPSIRWEVRVDMLRRMQAENLTPTDLDTLFDLLLNHQPATGQQENWYVVANEIMEQMRLQGIAPERYAQTMLELMRDPATSEVMRDYAVQHLGQWVTPRGTAHGHPHEQNPAIIRETAETIADLVTDPTHADTSVPGTSLMVLIDMQNGGVPDEIITPVIDSLNPWFTATLAGTNRTNKITRISAINAIGMLQLDTFRPTIRTLATDESADPNLRLNSVAVLGMIGQPDDIQTLKTLAATDTRFHYAAQAALKKLNSTP